MSHLYELERMRDWPAIVSSVPCPTCNALPGELCWEIHLSFGERKERNDFHVPRKLQAQYDWDHRNDPQPPEESPTPSTPDPDTQALTAEQQPPEGSAVQASANVLPLPEEAPNGGSNP